MHSLAADLHTLPETTCTTDVIAVCRAQLAVSQHVTYHPEQLARLMPTVVAWRGQPLEPWTFVRRDPQGSREDAVYDYALNAALNGGYFQQTSAGGVRQWAEGDSGSNALLTWLQRLHADRKLPGIDLTTVADVTMQLARYVEGLPLPMHRLNILAEYADPDIRTTLRRLVSTLQWNLGTYTFTWSFVRKLQQQFPQSFGGDPFAKKAILFCLEVAGYLEGCGERIRWHLPLPADYQLARIFQWAGVLTVSESFMAALRGETLLDVASFPVMDLRAATMVAATDLAELAEVPHGSATVDNALFLTFRRDPDFIANAPPPMRCASMWF